MDVAVELQRDGMCTTAKEYFPSPYETRHLLKAEEIAMVNNLAERHSLLLDFISSPEEVRAAQRWLERVKHHMTRAPATDDSRKKRSGAHSRETMKRLRTSHGKGRLGRQGQGQGQGGAEGGSITRRATSTSSWLHEQEHPHDREFMSKFVITTTCVGGASQQWVEWIEPLSVHGRHPFGE